MSCDSFFHDVISQISFQEQAKTFRGTTSFFYRFILSQYNKNTHTGRFVPEIWDVFLSRTLKCI